MLVRILLVLAVSAVALALFFGPWRGDDSFTQPAAEPAVVPAPLTPGGQDTVLLARPEEASSSAARTERVAETSDPTMARTFPCAVTGRCVDAQGKPLPRARLAHGESAILSGRDGRFQLDLVLPLEQRGDGRTLVASLEWYVTRSLEFVAAEQVELGDVVLAAAGSCSGRVVDADGNGVAGAEVLVTAVLQASFASRHSRPWNALVEDSADNSGAFRLTGVAAGDVRLWAGAPGMLWAYTDDLRVEAGEETRDIVLRLELRAESDEITLLVLDPEGDPVPRALIAYYDQGGGSTRSGSGSTDELGRYRHQVQFNATHDFVARDPEDRYRPATARSVPSGTTDRILQLGESKEFAIFVSRLGGEPVREFTAHCRTWLDDRPLSGQRTRAEDDDEIPGRAVIQLPLESFEITVEAHGHQSSTVGRFDPDTVGPSVEVILTPLPGVKGRVVDGTGQPLEGVLVGLHEFVADDWSLEVNGFLCRSKKSATASAKTDADGNFDLTLRQAGSFFLRASLEGLAPGEIGPLDLAPDLASHGLEVVLGEGGILEGRVIVALGESPAGRIVGISRADGFGVTARAGEKGGFRFTHLTPGRWLVKGRRDEILANSTSSSMGTVNEPQQLPWSCSVSEGQVTTFDLDLTRVGVVVVEGSFLLSGAPGVGWVATLSRPPNQRQVASDVVDSQGRFRLELDEPGAYRLQIVGQWQDSPVFFVMQELQLGVGTRNWSRDLPMGRVEGTTASAPGDRLNYSWSGDEELSVFCGFSPSESGTFGLPVPAGPGILRRVSQDGQGPEREIDVQAGATLRVDLQ